MTKFCINCRHYQPNEGSPDPAEYARCGAAQSTEDKRLHLVDGRPIRGRFCDVTRMDGAECGPDAKLFAPKLEAVS